MRGEAIALTDFVHNDITASAGKLIRHRDGSPLREGIALDLERAGLVRIRTIPSVAQPVTRTVGGPAHHSAIPAGKARDDGAGQPSSASPVAQASPTQTLSSSGSGGPKGRKNGAS